MLRSLAAAGFLGLSACSLALPPPGLAYDGGGNVAERAAQVARIVADGRPHVAPADCRSSCAMLLAAPNVCWPEGAVLRVHSARIGDLDPALVDAALDLAGVEVRAAGVVDRLNLLQAAHFPPSLRQAFLDGPARTRSTDYLVVPVADLVARGEARACE